MKRSAVGVGIVGVTVVLAALILARMTSSPSTGAVQVRPVSFQGEPIATVSERVSEGRGRGIAEHIERTVRFDAMDGSALLTADLDARGFVIKAAYDRPGERHVDLIGGVVSVDGRQRGTVSGPVVLVDLVHRVRVTTPTTATAFELSSMEQLSVQVERRGPAIVLIADGAVIVRAIPEGQRIGPGAFAEGDAPPSTARVGVEIAMPGSRSVAAMTIRSADARLPAIGNDVVAGDREPGAFLESDAPEVVAFALPLCAPQALETARRVATAVKARVDPAKTAIAPGAVRMLAAGGDCDGAAALAVAAMRACGYAARPLVGYVLVEAGTPQARLVPHALAEVYRQPPSGDEPGGWWRLDATVPAITDHDDRFIPVAVGLGGALTMGRLLGVVDAADVVADSPSPLEPNAGP